MTRPRTNTSCSGPTAHPRRSPKINSLACRKRSNLQSRCLAGVSSKPTQLNEGFVILIKEKWANLRRQGHPYSCQCQPCGWTRSELLQGGEWREVYNLWSEKMTTRDEAANGTTRPYAKTERSYAQRTCPTGHLGERGWGAPPTKGEK
jgi:hypothetical protein